jgi:hypothetical protein
MTPDQLAAIEFASQVSQVGMQDAKNLRQYNRQRKDNLTDWHRQNQYNSPVQQMARLKEAGLNPALMYGKSGGTGQATSPPSKTEMATGVVPDLNSGMKYAELELMKSNMKNNESQTDLNTLRGATEAQNAALLAEQTGKTAAEKQTAQATADLATELTNAALQAQLIDIQGKSVGIEKTKAETANVKQSTAESKNRVKVANSQLAINLKLSNAQVSNIEANINKINKELEKLGVDTQYMQELVYQTQAKTATEYIETEIKRLERDGYGTNNIITGALGQIARSIKSAL